MLISFGAERSYFNRNLLYRKVQSNLHLFVEFLGTSIIQNLIKFG